MRPVFETRPERALDQQALKAGAIQKEIASEATTVLQPQRTE